MYFALEESKEEFMLTLISRRLKEVYNISIGTMQLRSMGIHTLGQEVYEKIVECQEYFEELEEWLEVIDSVSNPFGIYDHVREYSNKHGTHHYKKKVFERKQKDGTIVEEVKEVYDRYEPDDPNEIVIVLVDHISLLMPENTEDSNTLHKAMTKMSAQYGRKIITKHYKYCLAIVQQQSAEKEKQQFTNTGQSIESKLEPSLDGLGDNKLTQRDALIVIGLFAPERYKIDRHRGYNINILKDRYRSISILKNRLGTPNVSTSLYFDGETNTFAVLPQASSPDMEEIYEKIKRHEEAKKKKS